MTTQLTDDVVALQRLQAGYADVVSRRAWPELAELFLPDCAVHLDLVTSPTRTFVGPDDFAAFVSGAIAHFDHFTFVILNSVFDVDVESGEATARMFMCEIRHDPSSDQWSRAHGLYQDRYRRVDGRWWFAERHYRSLAREAPGGAILGLPDLPPR